MLITAQSEQRLSPPRLQVYCNQYRSGSLLRAYQVWESPGNETTVIHSGERTFFTHTTAIGEVNPATDDWLVEIANQGTNAFTSALNNVEIMCYLAQ